MITYEQWRAIYLKQYKGALYVDYNAEQLLCPRDACTASEAIGYGMLISVLGRNRVDFDGLLAFYRMFTNKNGLMSWQLLKRGAKIFFNPHGGENSATDGDMDAAFALFLAADLWQEPDYRGAAIVVCAALYRSCFNHQTHISMPGDFATPGSTFHTVSRPSDYMLTHLARFAEEDTARSSQWLCVVEATVRTIQYQLRLHPTGLMADFVRWSAGTRQYEPVKGRVLERPRDGCYNWNSCRSPWRLAAYFAESNDKRMQPILAAMVRFFESQDLIVAGYTLDGRPLENYTHICFQAPVWCLFKVMGSAQLGKLEHEMARMPKEIYFGDTIQLLCQMQTDSTLNLAQTSEPRRAQARAAAGRDDSA